MVTIYMVALRRSRLTGKTVEQTERRRT